MTQSWDPKRYDKNARFVSDLGAPVLALLNPQPGERILDLGCGDGPLTQQLVNLGCDVLGIDASPEQIEAAQKLGLSAQVMDGHDLPFEQEFDAVFSNATLHWLTRPDEVLAGVYKSLKPGGRFVAEFGGDGNVATVVAAVTQVLAARGIDSAEHNPWYFPSVNEYRERLEAHNFDVHSIELIDRPTPIPGDIAGWLETFAESFLVAVPVSERAVLLDELRECLRPDLCDASGNWTVDYVRLRFAAGKQSD
ncbi:MAG: methyltransferase domain-containing protein [Gammaproteobacteria bacterium]|nr:methyltransferase domain-containing protein [Gammaproteobacteria bacterium]